MTATRPRLVFVNRFFYPDLSATSQILSDVAFDLADLGWPVRVITSAMRYDRPGDRLKPRETVNDVEIIRVATSRFGRDRLAGRAADFASFYATASLAALRHVEAGDILIVKTDPPLLSVPLGAAARLRGARLVNWLQDLYPEVAAELGIGPARGAAGRALTGLRNRALMRAELNIVIGSRMAERLQELGVAAERIQLLTNFADAEAIQPVAREANPLRAEWGFDADDFVIGYSGNLGRAHDLETVLGAAAALKDEKRIRFLFIGGGTLRAELTHRIKALGLANVTLKPYQPREQLSHSLSVPDLHWLSLKPELEGLIVPSKAYGIAAAGRGMIFIGDRDGEIARLLDTHDCGEHFAIGESDRLAGRLLDLSRAPDTVAVYGRAARRFIEAEASRSRLAAQWDAVCNALVAGKTAGLKRD